MRSLECLVPPGLVGWWEDVTRGVLFTEPAGDVTLSGGAGTDLRG